MNGAGFTLASDFRKAPPFRFFSTRLVRRTLSTPYAPRSKNNEKSGLFESLQFRRYSIKVSTTAKRGQIAPYARYYDGGCL